MRNVLFLKTWLWYLICTSFMAPKEMDKYPIEVEIIFINLEVDESPIKVESLWAPLFGYVDRWWYNNFSLVVLIILLVVPLEVDPFSIELKREIATGDWIYGQSVVLIHIRHMTLSSYQGVLERFN